MIKAGFKEIDYTPIEGFMPGEYDPYYARGARLPLQANAGAFTNGEESVILIAMDHVELELNFANDIRNRISEATGVPFQNILLAASHTHTGANMGVVSMGTPAEPEIARILALRTVKAGIAAFENQKEVTLSYGATEEKRYSFCRNWVLKDGRLVTNPGYNRTDLDHPLTDPDHSIQIMKVEQDGKIVAILVNYANHPDCHRGYERDKFSPDYPGYMREALKNAYGRDVVVLFFNGCCGDTSDRDFENGTDRTTHRRDGVCPPQIIGEGLAESIGKIFNSLTVYDGEDVIKAQNRIITVKHRQLTDEQREEAYALQKKSEVEYLDCYDLETMKRYLAGIEHTPETVDIEIGAIRVGPWAIVSIPAEVYTVIGNTIKKISPYENTIISELSNGCYGYIVPDDGDMSSTYEGGFGAGDCGEGTATAVIENAKQMLDQMK